MIKEATPEDRGRGVSRCREAEYTGRGRCADVITKEQMLEAIRALPDDATVDDAIERLHLIDLVERRIAAADAGETVTHEEALRRMAQWLQ